MKEQICLPRKNEVTYKMLGIMVLTEKKNLDQKKKIGNKDLGAMG